MKKALVIITSIILVFIVFFVVWFNYKPTKTSYEDFSYAEDCKIYIAGESGVKTTRFVNITDTEISSIDDAIERAKNECTIQWDGVTTYFDAKEHIWKVLFYTEGILGGGQSVYLDENGKTVLIVYGE